jgi:hypothetical protein
VATIENANKQKASATQLVDGRQEKVWSRIQSSFEKKEEDLPTYSKKKSKNMTLSRDLTIALFSHHTITL